MENSIKIKYRGMNLFMLEIIHLISNGKKETIEDIERNIENNKLIEYIYEKYKDEFCIKFDGSLYDNEELNRWFYDFSGIIKGNEDRKYGVINPDDGLLIILALISELLRKLVEEKPKE